MHFVGTYLAKPDARHPGDFILELRAAGVPKVRTIDAATIPKRTPLREVAERWCAKNGHTLRIDWTSLTNDTP